MVNKFTILYSILGIIVLFALFELTFFYLELKERVKSIKFSFELIHCLLNLTNLYRNESVESRSASFVYPILVK